MQPNDKRIAWRAGCSPFPLRREKRFVTARRAWASFHFQKWTGWNGLKSFLRHKRDQGVGSPLPYCPNEALEGV